MVDYTEEKGYQYHIHTNKDNVGGYVIVTGDPGRCKSIAQYLDDPELIASNREYTTYTGKLCGAHTLIRVGTCGGIQLDVKGGDLIIATGAIRMEGTTKEYVPVEFPAVANYEVVGALAFT